MKYPAVVAAACAALALGTAAQPALASVVKESAHGLLLVEPVLAPAPGQPAAPDPGENNTLKFTQSASNVVVTDSTAPMAVSGTGCTLTTAPGAVPSAATCTGPLTHIDAQGGNGNDTITNATSIPALLDGGRGDDVLRAGTGSDTLVGSAGLNTLYGGTGSDTIYTQGRGSNYATSKRKSSVYCMAGANTTVYAAANDTVAPECKTVIRAKAPGAAPTPTPPGSGSGSGSGGAPPAGQPVRQPGPPAVVPVTQGAGQSPSPAVSPRMRVVSARVVRRVLRVRGTLARQAGGAVRVSMAASVGGRTVRMTRTAGVNRSAGTFAFAMRLGPRLRRARHLVLVVHYAGDRASAPETVRRTIAVH